MSAVSASVLISIRYAHGCSKICLCFVPAMFASKVKGPDLVWFCTTRGYVGIGVVLAANLIVVYYEQVAWVIDQGSSL